MITIGYTDDLASLEFTGFSLASLAAIASLLAIEITIKLIAAAAEYRF